MKRTHPWKPTLYTLQHGVEIIGEYPPNKNYRYWRVRVRPHPFFEGKRVVSGGIDMARSRAVMSAHLGRKLESWEHVHHGEQGREVDDINNLELLTAADHNRHHHKGWKHPEWSKEKIGAGVRRAYDEGRMNQRYRCGTEQHCAKLNDKKVRHIRTSSESCIALSKRYGVSKQVILSVKHRKTWRHVE